MGGGLMQLVAYGAQDIYLTGNPQITFFKVVYRRHTNFAMESVEQTLNGNIAGGNKVTATISRNGDLVGRMYLEVTTANGDTAVANVGAACIDSVEVQIGGQQIDKHYGHWMETWAELTEPNSSCLTSAVGGNGTLFQELAGMGGCNVADGVGALELTVPLQFWFNRNPGLALPLIALQYHEVKVLTTFSSVAGTGTNFDAKLWADYIYLDTDERRRFAQVSHEYLIEQVQHTNSTGTSHDLNFNHPVKELVWTGGMGTTTAGVIDEVANGNYRLVLNGHDRMAERPRKYFTHTQVWQHHTGPGGLAPATAGVGSKNSSIAVYSFALKPEEHQPSGTCNFSRIDNAQLKSPSDTLDIYAVNYNVLRVMSGMGGLAYSN
jgi:hypothetical protein